MLVRLVFEVSGLLRNSAFGSGLSDFIKNSAGFLFLTFNFLHKLFGLISDALNCSASLIFKLIKIDSARN